MQVLLPASHAPVAQLVEQVSTRWGSPPRVSQVAAFKSRRVLFSFVAFPHHQRSDGMGMQHHKAEELGITAQQPEVVQKQNTPLGPFLARVQAPPLMGAR